MNKVQEQSGYENTPEWRGYCKLMEERPKSFRGGGYPKIVTDVRVVDRFVRENHVKIGLIYQSPYNTFLVDLVEEKDGLVVSLREFSGISELQFFILLYLF